MNIKCADVNEQKINQLIKYVEGKARERVISYQTMKRELNDVLVRLKITKIALEGTTVLINANACSFSQSYNGIPMSTFFIAKMKRGTWNIIEIERRRCSNVTARFSLSNTAEKAILHNTDY